MQHAKNQYKCISLTVFVFQGKASIPQLDKTYLVTSFEKILNVRCKKLSSMEITKEDMSEDKKDEREWWRKSLEKILKKTEKWIEVDDVDVRRACAPGENFVADVFRVVVYGRRLYLGVWTDIRKNLIVKKIPDPNAAPHRYCNCLQMFQNETTAYEYILPLCQSHLDKKSTNDDINELSFAKYYGQCQTFLVLQDLQPEGYQLVNRVKGFSMRECAVVLRELSKLHALSIALKKEDEISLRKTVNKLHESLFHEDQNDTITGIYWENAARCAARSLDESGDERLKRACQGVKVYYGRILRTLIDLVKSDYSKFEVLCHGDLWSNNILLRYCDSGYPIGAKFIDLQAMRYTSCVLDVMHLLFTSSRPVVFERHFKHLLKEYYDSLATYLKNLNESLDFTFDEFMAEFKAKIPYGVYLSCLMLTFVTRTTPFDPSEIDSTKKDLSSEAEVQKMYETLTPAYHERLRALFLALTDANLI